jgi:hypothetical protein
MPPYCKYTKCECSSVYNVTEDRYTSTGQIFDMNAQIIVNKRYYYGFSTAKMNVQNKLVSFSEEFHPYSGSCLPCFTSTPYYGNLTFSPNTQNTGNRLTEHTCCRICTESEIDITPVIKNFNFGATYK